MNLIALPEFLKQLDSKTSEQRILSEQEFMIDGQQTLYQNFFSYQSIVEYNSRF